MAWMRHVEVAVGPKDGEGFKIDALKIEFTIEKTDEVESNTSKIRIFNLSKETSDRVCVAGNHITLKAGYTDETVAAIFFGDVVKGERLKDGTEYITELEVYDGRTALMEGFVSVSYAKDTEAKTVVQAFLDSIGLPFKGLDLVPNGESYSHGYAFIGMAGDGLRDVLNKFDLAYTIQNGMLYIIKPGEAADRTGLKLTPETGLLTIPQKIVDKTADDDNAAEASNCWKFSAMLFPELIPGAACKVESSTLNGEVIIRKSVMTGDNWDGDFKVDIEAEVA